MTTSVSSTRGLVLRPTTTLSLQDFRDAWEYRELAWILALRDVRVRYKQASLGVAWALWFFVERSSIACAKHWFQIGARHGSTISEGISDQAGLEPKPIAGA